MEVKRRLQTDLFGRPNRKQSINSKDKGDNNERVACKWLLSWVLQEFARTPSSGGLHWNENSSVAGDVVCTNPKFNFIFVVETKHYKIYNEATIMKAGKEKIVNVKYKNDLYIRKAWSQAVSDADRVKKLPLVLYRLNNYPEGRYMFIPPEPVVNLLKMEGLTPCYEHRHITAFWSDEVLKIPYVDVVEFLNKLNYL